MNRLSCGCSQSSAFQQLFKFKFRFRISMKYIRKRKLSTGLYVICNATNSFFGKFLFKNPVLPLSAFDSFLLPKAELNTCL